MLSSIMPLTMAATQLQMQQNDQLQSGTIQTEMEAAAQRYQVQNWQIQQETQTKTYQMLQETTAQRVKTQEKVYEKWISVIRD